MRRLLFLLSLGFSTSLAADLVMIAPAEAARLVADGKAILVDVREPAEWVETGVAEPALLLPKSEFDAGLAGDWKSFLEKIEGRLVITYCRSGKRADAVAAALAARGQKVANAGGFKDWQAAGQPVRKVGPDKP